MVCSHFPYFGPPITENMDHDVLHDMENVVSGNRVKTSFSTTRMKRFQWGVALPYMNDVETPRTRARTAQPATRTCGSPRYTPSLPNRGLLAYTRNHSHISVWLQQRRGHHAFNARRSFGKLVNRVAT